MSVTAADIIGVTTAVCREWNKQRKAEERGTRSRASRADLFADKKITHAEVADAILPDAYDHASGGNKYPTLKRQLYYACRQAFKDATGRELKAAYFSNTLLVQFLNRNPDLEWKLAADPRGVFTIPNCGREVAIPIGTLAIDRYLRSTKEEIKWF